MIYSLVKMGLKSWLNMRFIAMAIFIFLLHSYLSFQLYGHQKLLIETLILYFYGPQVSIIDTIRWLLHQFPIIMLIGLIIHTEFKERAAYIIYRVGSVHKWLFSLSSVTAIIVFVYYAIGLLITTLFITLINTLGLEKSASPASFHFVDQYLIAVSLLQMLLIAIMTLAMALSGMFFALWLRNSILSLVINIMFIVLTISFKDVIPSLIKWLIPAQGMLNFRIMHDWSAYSAIIYLIFILLIVGVLLHAIIRKQIDNLIISDDI